jgi:multidrug efflux pump subunit AcrA (membrane-fusion protein)
MFAFPRCTRLRGLTPPARRLVLVLVLLGSVGLGLGMALRAWLVPRLPPSVARYLGLPGAGQHHEGAEGQAGREVAFWKSSMIPNFVSPRPGVDPMGMDLVPVYRDELGQEKFIILDHQTMNNMGLRTVPVVRGKAERVVRSFGQVDYAEPLLRDVSLKVSGWVEDLNVDYVGQRVKKGQPLFSFYSPDLVITQEDYLLSLKGTDMGGTGMKPILQAEDRLRYWDVPASEIEAIRRAGKTRKSITFVSPSDGWVIRKHAFPGMYMKEGTLFYRIADLSRMWVQVAIYEFQLPWVKEGQQARLTLPFQPGKSLEGKVVYVYPHVDPKTRQIQVRLEFPNPDLQLKPGMYANVEIATQPEADQLLVPLDAVIYTGQHRTIQSTPRRVGRAFVRVGPGRFEPREVVLGEDAERGQVQVLSGLAENEVVVVSGQFQLESERKVKEANLRMLTQAGSTGNTSAPSERGASAP